MRNGIRHVILITLVATALCADRATLAIPTINHTVATVATRVASRLAGNYRRTNRDYRSAQWPTSDQSASASAVPSITQFYPDHFTFTPFQFRLPPPSL